MNTNLRFLSSARLRTFTGMSTAATLLFLAAMPMSALIPSQVIVWGDDAQGQTNVPSRLTNGVALAAGGYSFSMALQVDGTVVAWGPTNITGWTSGLSNVMAIASSGMTVLALQSNGTVAGWVHGAPAGNIPSGLSNVVAVAAGVLHGLALKADSTVVAWGDNDSGQTNVPGGLAEVVAVAAGWHHSLALKTDGTVAAWGWNSAGQINVPGGLTNVMAIAAGYDFSLALQADGTVVAWGGNGHGQTNVPGGLTNVVAIAAGAGGNHSLALQAGGTVVAWGRNTCGQTNVPGDLTDVVAIAAGDQHSLALKSMGPAVTVPPASQSVLAGDSLSLRVMAAGALAYQWQFHGTNLPGANNTVLPINGAQPGQAGPYRVVVSNASCMVTSAPAQLTVVPSRITAQPQSRTNLMGTTATFSVTAVGAAPLTCVWRLNGTNQAISASFSHSITNVQPAHAGDYTVVVSNLYGSVTSQVAALSLSYLPVTITKQPVSRTVAHGQTAGFSVTVTGTPTGYQWYFSNTLQGACAPLTRKTDALLTLSPAFTNDTGSYFVVVTNPVSVVTSAVVSLTVTNDTHPPSVTVSFPAKDAQVMNAGPSQITFLGEATDKERVESALLQVNGGPTNTAVLILTNSGTKAFWSSEITVMPGTNWLVAWSLDAWGNASSRVTNRFFFNVHSPVTLVTNGEGGIVFKLGAVQVTNGQPLLVHRPYTASAVAGTNGLGWLFTNWSVTAYGVTTYYPTNKLTFLMESNLALQANYVSNLFTLAAGKYHGLFAPESGVAHASSGFFKAATDKKQGVSGTACLDGDSVTFSGKFGLDGHAVCTASRTKLGKSPLVLDLWLDLADTAQQLTGTIACPVLVPPYTNGPTFTASLTADKETFNKTNHQATAHQGVYALVIPPVDGPTNAPGGFGYASVTVVSNGLVKLAGVLGDGEKYSHTGVPLSKDGLAPFWQPLYKGLTVWETNGVLRTNKDSKGEIMGWLTFAPNTNATPGSTNLAPLGTLSWVKTGWTNLYYPAGFTNEADVMASKFTPGATTTNRVMPWSEWIYTLTGWGGMEAPVTNLSQVYSARNELLTNTVAGFKAKVDAKTGLISGQFTNTTPDPVLKTLFYGVVLQDWNIGYGVFAGAPASGQTGYLIMDEGVPSAHWAYDRMALIPAGEFTMGDAFGEDNGGDASPLHTVRVSAFYMDKHEVTKALWDNVAAWAAAHGYGFQSGDNCGLGKAANHPAHSVNWYDAVKWCNARSEKLGLTPAYYTDAGLTATYKAGEIEPFVKWNARGYRLPTEAEWEKAARGGVAGRRFPWTNAGTITHSQANYYSDSDPIWPYNLSPDRAFHPTYATNDLPYTNPVGAFAANGYGLYNMAGNVTEWCWDWYGDYSGGFQADPRGPSLLNGVRVARGGSWYEYAYYCRVAMRIINTPPFGWNDWTGFRSVLIPDQP